MKNSFFPVVAGTVVFLVVSVFFFFKFFSVKAPLPVRESSMSTTALPHSDLGTPTKTVNPKTSAAFKKFQPASEGIKSIPALPKLMGPENEIQKIRKELQAVMDLNKKISQVQTSRSDLMTRIDQKTQSQQKILGGIQKLNINTSVIPVRETLLAQEKLRLIREETMRGEKILDEVQSKKLR